MLILVYLFLRLSATSNSSDRMACPISLRTSVINGTSLRSLPYKLKGKSTAALNLYHFNGRVNITRRMVSVGNYAYWILDSHKSQVRVVCSLPSWRLVWFTLYQCVIRPFRRHFFLFLLSLLIILDRRRLDTFQRLCYNRSVFVWQRIGSN